MAESTNHAPETPTLGGREEASNRSVEAPAEDEAPESTNRSAPTTEPEEADETGEEPEKDADKDVEMREDSTGTANDGDGEEEEEQPQEEEQPKEDADDSQPMQPEKLYFGPTEYSKACTIQTRCAVSHVVDVIGQLPEELKWFRAHPEFKHIFHMFKEPNHMNQGL